MREHSILLCRDAMGVAVSSHKKQTRKDVGRSLMMPLFFHLHDRDQSVAQVGISKPLACAAAGHVPPEEGSEPPAACSRRAGSS